MTVSITSSNSSCVGRVFKKTQQTVQKTISNTKMIKDVWNWHDGRKLWHSSRAITAENAANPRQPRAMPDGPPLPPAQRDYKELSELRSECIKCWQVFADICWHMLTYADWSDCIHRPNIRAAHPLSNALGRLPEMRVHLRLHSLRELHLALVCWITRITREMCWMVSDGVGWPRRRKTSGQELFTKASRVGGTKSKRRGRSRRMKIMR